MFALFVKGTVNGCSTDDCAPWLAVYNRISLIFNRHYDTLDMNYLENKNSIISCWNNCQTEDAKLLGIYDVSYKLKCSSEYEIGGSYTNAEADLWFYYTTSTCPGSNYLLNLFVCYRKRGCFTVNVSNNNMLVHIDNKFPDGFTGCSLLPDTLIHFSFKSARPNEHFYIKTFCFSDKDIQSIGGYTLMIPVKLEINTRRNIDSEVIRNIKLEHDFGMLLPKQEKTDIILESANKKSYPVHKIILAAHSPVLRQMVKNSKESTLFLDISDSDMELLLEYIYTGTIKNLFDQDCFKLLQIANKLQLDNMCSLAQYAIGKQININNAVEVALLSQKYKLKQLQNEVFKFIANHTEVMESVGWKSLHDVTLAKKISQFIQSNCDT